MNSQDKKIQDVVLIIPSYNEGPVLLETLSNVENFFEKIIVVDDGSTKKDPELIANNRILLIKHPVNLGQGAALQTGISAALKFTNANYFITFDADGQHSIESALSLVHKIKGSSFDIVIGSRFLQNSTTNVSLPRKLLLKLAVLFTRMESGLKVTDAHNGLRIFNRKFAETIKLKQNGMAHASEILSYIKEFQFNWAECPVDITYTEYSRRKGQSALNAVNIVTELFHR